MNLPPGRFPLLPRKRSTHKGDYGHVLVVAGSRSYPGAALLCSRAAYAAGAGLVTLAAPDAAKEAIGRRLAPEVMPLFLSSTRRGTFSTLAYRPIRRFISERNVTSLALGPGLGRDHATCSLVRRLIHVGIPTVLDADALNAFEGQPSLLRRNPSPLVLTPHSGEFRRLFGRPVPDADRKGRLLAKKLASLYDVVLVLKGHRTRVVQSDRDYRNTTGNPGMAKGGTGDVLTGILAAFMAQGLEAFEAACWAVYLHGRAGDLAAKEKTQLAVMASDLIDRLPGVFRWSSSVSAKERGGPVAQIALFGRTRRDLWRG